MQLSNLQFDLQLFYFSENTQNTNIFPLPKTK